MRRQIHRCCSRLWYKLYNFQKDGVLGAIDKLEEYNGCILADSVGLGKTFEALAIIKYYELRNNRVLVLCPKKLRENWLTYRANRRDNILEKDRLNYDVLNHTDLSRYTGHSGDINLEEIYWENYELIDGASEALGLPVQGGAHTALADPVLLYGGAGQDRGCRRA